MFITWNYSFRRLQIGHMDHFFDHFMVPFGHCNFIQAISLYGYEWTFSTQLTQTKVKQVLIYKKVSYDKNFIPLHNIGSAVCTCVFTWNKWPPKKPSYQDWRQKISWHRLHTPSSRTLSPHVALPKSCHSRALGWLGLLFSKPSAFCPCMITRWIC